jgi:hypothetical protein
VKEGNGNLATHSMFRTLNFRGGQLAVWLALNFTAIRRATTIPARVIPIMPGSINVAQNKSMVLIQIGFYSFKP